MKFFRRNDNSKKTPHETGLSPSSISPPLFTYIYSKVNELYAKIKINQKFLNLSENPLELKIYINKRRGVFFLH